MCMYIYIYIYNIRANKVYCIIFDIVCVKLIMLHYMLVTVILVRSGLVRSGLGHGRFYALTSCTLMASTRSGSSS